MIFYKLSLLVEWAISVTSFFLGVSAAIAPNAVIQLYQWIMRNFNWDVRPVDFEKELRNTRLLGLVSALLGSILAIILLIIT
ncbi:MAG: hypothetical protein HYY14_04665 [Candidatus Omnitrophica bacterium]|nr:hypothetical protein [Candidatus Omnitrophota bacterium]